MSALGDYWSSWASTNATIGAIGTDFTIVVVFTGNTAVVTVLTSAARPKLHSDRQHFDSVITARTVESEQVDLQPLGCLPAWGFLGSQVLACQETSDFGKGLIVKDRQPTATVKNSDQMLNSRTEKSITDD